MAKTSDAFTQELHELCNSWPDKPELIQELLEQGADMEALDEGGQTPLFNACEHVKYKTIALLVEKGADKTVTNSKGEGLLLLACYGNGFRYVEFLLSLGFNANAASKDGTTPVLAVCKKGNTEILELLYSNGAELNARNSLGQTALIIAVQENKHKAVKWLLKHGADPLVQDTKGKNALDYIKSDSHEELIYNFKNEQIFAKKASIEISNIINNACLRAIQSKNELLQKQIDEISSKLAALTVTQTGETVLIIKIKVDPLMPLVGEDHAFFDPSSSE